MLTAAHVVISQLHLLRITNVVSCALRIPVLSISCQEAVVPMTKPCALIPDSVHMCHTLVPKMLCHLSHGTDCPKTWKVLRLPLRSYRLSNRISQFRFDTPTQSVSWSSVVLSLDEGLQSSPLFPLRPNQLIL